MPATIDAVRRIELDEIREARKRIAGTVVRTPLLRLELGSGYPEIRLKLENLQPINAYKLRGAVNAVAMLSESARRQGGMDDWGGQRRTGHRVRRPASGGAMRGRGD